jgi:hypothetical protein
MRNLASSPRGRSSRPAREILLLSLTAIGLVCLGSEIASATIVATSGTVVIEPNPFPPASDTAIFVFDEQQSVAFVADQPLDFGSIAAGTMVNSHYIQYDSASATGTVGPGSVTFDGAILGVITTTAHLNATLSSVPGTSDSYFGLETTLGAYPAGAPGTEQFRGLGSPMDSLMVSIGSDTLIINGLDIETPGALDGIRVLTAIPEPSAALLVALGIVGFAARRDTRSRPGVKGHRHHQ